MAAVSAEAKVRQREYQKRWYRENRERVLAQQAEYDAANREQVAAKNARWRTANLESVRAKERAWKRANRDKVAEYDRRRYERYGDELRAAARLRHHRDPETARARAKAFREANPDYFVLKCAERRARLMTGADLTSEEWTEILEEFDHRCAYCQTPDGKLEIEHMTPLIRGGRHTASNVVPACRSCNASKGRRTIFEFLAFV